MVLPCNPLLIGATMYDPRPADRYRAACRAAAARRQGLALCAAALCLPLAGLALPAAWGMAYAALAALPPLLVLPVLVLVLVALLHWLA